MNPKQFFDLVVKMRQLQQTVKRTHGFDRKVADEVGKTERAVDAEIARVRLLERERLQIKLDL